MKKKFNESWRKILIYIWGALFVCISMIAFYIFIPNSFKSFDNQIVDYMFTLRGEIKGSPNIAIIDIDEKSIAALGQWPWSRDIVASLVDKTTALGAGIIGFDIVFAELDRTSPSTIFAKHNLVTKEKPQNYDAILANSIANAPVILGYQFEMVSKPFLKKEAPAVPAVFIEKNKQDGYVLEAFGTILNNEILQPAGYSSGFFNNIPDESGITRSVPMIIKYDNQIYPSLALEMIRAANDIKKVVVNYNELGVENIQLGDFFIPTDRYGRLMINFRGKEKSYEYISALDIIEGKVKKEQIEGKIFLVGTSAAGLFDLRATPFESIFPGVEIHANAIDNILTGDYLTSPAWVDGANITNIILITFLATFAVYFSTIYLIPLFFTFMFGLIVFANYYLLFQYHISINTFFPIITLVLSFVVALLINYFFETKQKELIKQKFSSKVSKAVMEDILKNPDNEILSAQDKEVTIFFSDVRGFTTISEAMPSPRALIDYLNTYLTPITDIIINNEGTIDKYIGDAVMAYWNAPADVANHQDKAIKASLEQFVFLQTLNTKLTAQNLPIIEIGIGLNTGSVTVGEMGSASRSDYTVIGDAINLGSRLESLCKTYGAKIIISEFTKIGLTDTYIIRCLDLVRVKGKNEPVEIFEVLDFAHTPLLYSNIQTIQDEVLAFNEAITMYRKSNFSEAKEQFEAILNQFDVSNPTIYQMYIQRCDTYIQTPPADFDGVFTHTSK